MTTDTQVRSQCAADSASKPAVCGETVVGYAILGCLVAGTVGILKAIYMDGVGAGACLLESVAAFVAVGWFYFRQH
jgi:hypothetical protein